MVCWNEQLATFKELLNSCMPSKNFKVRSGKIIEKLKSARDIYTSIRRATNNNKYKSLCFKDNYYKMMRIILSN